MRTLIAIALAIFLALVLAIIVVEVGAHYGNNRSGYEKPLNQYFGTALVKISSGNTTYFGSVYIAANLSQQERGYMNSTSIGNCGNASTYKCVGMLFVFENDSVECFWMENTQMPLRQLWINNNYTVVYAYNASPYSTSSICYPGMYVLETQLDIPVGAKIVYPANGTQ